MAAPTPVHGGEPILPVILAAGLGSRLGGEPKALYELEGERLVDRTAQALRSRGFTELMVVTGHGRDAVIDHCHAGVGGLEVRFVHNERYADRNNFFTVAVACEAVRQPLMIINSDIVFMPEVLDGILAGRSDAGAVVDGAPVDHEAMGIAVRDGRVTEFGKHVPSTVAAGEFIGISVLGTDALRAAYMRASDAALRAGEHNLYYEDVYSRLVGEFEMTVTSVDASDWAEVDCEEDLPRAREVAIRQDATAHPA